jgi:hypothetical protein
MKVILLGAKVYDFDGAEGRIVGTKLSYILPEPTPSEDGFIGNPPIQVTIQENITPELVELPGMYDFDFTMVPGRNNIPSMKLQSIKFINGIDFKKCQK